MYKKYRKQDRCVKFLYLFILGNTNSSTAQYSVFLILKKDTRHLTSISHRAETVRPPSTYYLTRHKEYCPKLEQICKPITAQSIFTYIQAYS